jgi:hypothetical protein
LEPLFLIAFVYLFGLLAVGRSGWREWQKSRREKRMRGWAATLQGRPAGEALAAFGPAFEIFEGSTRRLYEWKSPPSDAFPPAPGLLIVYVVTGPDGNITSVSWHTRGE